MGLSRSEMEEYLPLMAELKAKRQNAKEEHLAKLSTVLLPHNLEISSVMHEMREAGASLADLRRAYGTKNQRTIDEYLTLPNLTGTTPSEAQDNPQGTDPEAPWGRYVTVTPLPAPNQDIAEIVAEGLPVNLIEDGLKKSAWVKSYKELKLTPPKTLSFRGRMALTTKHSGRVDLVPLTDYLTRSRSVEKEAPPTDKMVWMDAKPGHPLYDMFIDAGVEPKPWGYVEK